MSKMIICCGLPGSGKTSYAIARARADSNIIVVERDQLRKMMYGTYYGPEVDEDQVTAAQIGLINAMFKKDRTVIVSDTNLRRKNVQNLVNLANRWGAQIEFVYFDVPVDTCVERDKARAARGERAVGEQVIREKAKAFIKGGYLVPRFDDMVAVAQSRIPYDPPDDLPQAIICDLDGTVALHNRSPHDYDLLWSDSPNHSIIDIVKTEWNSYTSVLFVSGRPDSHREMTVAWLDQHIGINPDFNSDAELFMRKTGDKRMDAIVKYELFDNNIRNKWDIKYVLDDRTQCVDVWRSIGLTCLQVAFGDF